MNPTIRNVLAVLAGIVVGMFINGGIIQISSFIVPPPPGTDMTSVEGIKAALPLLEPKHFLMPFLAHAIGALSGGLVGGFLAVSRKSIIAISLSALSLLGGIAAAAMIPAPTWFIACDLLLAYIPMGLLASKITSGGWLPSATTKQ